MARPIETDVLIVGSGPAGSACALALSRYGIANMVVTKYRWLADTPRAHITNQRTMEVLRDLGVEEEVNAQRAHQDLMGNNVFCTSLAGEEIGRLLSWGNHPARKADYTLSSPTTICDVPQDLMEPILFSNACKAGTHARFDTEYRSLVQDETGVTATVRDRLGGADYEIRARYLVGADGGRSKVAEDIGLPMVGRMGVGGSMNIVFEADLSRFVAHRPSVLYWVLQPGADIGGIGMGLVRMVRPWTKWLIVWGYDIGAEPPVMDDAVATAVAHHLIGDDTVPVRIESYSLWTVNHMYAERNTRGRVFCMGDAVHRHPPSNGLGSNTSIQDAYNLAWKLAHVLKGKAAPSLLDSYDAERSPIARQVVERANKSIGEFGPIFDSLGLLSSRDPEQMKRNMEARKADTPEAAEQRERLRAAIAHKSYEFNAHGVEMNQRYASTAIVPDGTEAPPFRRDPELFYEATTRPGARLPHVWLERDGRRISSLDLAGHGRFTLLTGIGGDAWVAAAEAVARERGLAVAAFVIGPGREVHDLFGDWAEMRETAETGCVLVRPDQHVAFRSRAIVPDARAVLAAAFARILGDAAGDAPPAAG
jgi:2,4-dichlorophenol 6-monooxygenase